MEKKENPRVVRLVIDSDLRNVFFVGIMTRNLCAFMDMERDECDRAELAVVEATNNAIIHAYGREKGNFVDVAITVLPDRIVFQVCDTGKKMERFLPKPPDHDPESPEDLPEDKMGLFLIETAMDQMDYRSGDGRNVLTLTKYIKRREPA